MPYLKNYDAGKNSVSFLCTVKTHLDFRFDIFNSVRGFDLEGNSFSGEGLYEDLHSSSQSKNQVKGRLFLDVVVGKSSAILELFSSENKTLLIRGDTLFILWKNQYFRVFQLTRVNVSQSEVLKIRAKGCL